MSEQQIINFFKASKHINILDLVKSPVYSDINSEQYQGFRLKILALTQKFEKYLEREHERFVKSKSHVDNLTKTANQIRKKFRSKAKREQLTKLILKVFKKVFQKFYKFPKKNSKKKISKKKFQNKFPKKNSKKKIQKKFQQIQQKNFEKKKFQN